MDEDQQSCASCGKPNATLACKCRRVSYCDTFCQGSDWALHKVACTVHSSAALEKLKAEGGSNDQIADATQNLADLFAAQGRLGEAVRYCVETVELRRRAAAAAVAGGAEGGAGEDAKVAAALHKLGVMYEREGFFRDALEALEESLVRPSPDNHPEPKT